MDNISVRQIVFNTKEYSDELALRDEILRRPLDLDIFLDDLSEEVNDIHIGAFDGDVLAGVLVLTKIDDANMKMRQVAVSEKYQKQGIGSDLVAFGERISKLQGFSRITLHSRKSAIGFYLNLGYDLIGKEFFEIGIAHRAMEKILNNK